MSDLIVCPICEVDIPANARFLCPYCKFDLKWLDDKDHIAEERNEYLKSKKDGDSLDAPKRKWFSSLISDPHKRLKISYILLFLVGGLSWTIGVLLGVFQKNVTIENVLLPIILGGVYIVLGFFVKRRSKVALVIALVLYGLDTFLMTVQGINSDGQQCGITLRFFIFGLMLNGLGAIKELQTKTEKVNEVV